MTDSYPNGTGLCHKPYEAVHYAVSTFVARLDLYKDTLKRLDKDRNGTFQLVHELRAGYFSGCPIYDTI